MRKTLIFLILLILPLISTAEEKPAADPRLLQPVTTESTGKRLYSVVDEISKATGVTIRCGNDSKDWRVRDIPVAVCTHELPLGVLLQSLADCTHLYLTREEGADGVSYQIWGNEEHQKYVDEYMKQARAHRLAMAAWGWDVAAQLKDVPLTAFSLSPLCRDRVRSATSPVGRALSQLVVALGPSVRDKVLAGEELRLDPKSTPKPLRGPVAAFRKASLQAEYERRRSRSPDRQNIKPPSEKDLEESPVVVSFHGAVMIYTVSPYNAAPSLPHGDIAECVEGRDFPPRPQRPEVPGIEREGVKLLRSPGSRMPALNAKVNLKKPEGKASLTYVDVLAAVSKASGLSVICEDFVGHRRQWQTPDSLFGKDMDIRQVFGQLSFQLPMYWDEEHQLVMACDDLWPERHANLAPEELLNHLIARLNGNGVDLEDMAAVAHLTYDQRTEWLVRSPYMESLKPSPRPMIPLPEEVSVLLWYDSLSAQDKAELHTQTGLPLSRFDPQVLRTVFDAAVNQFLANPEETSGCSVRIAKQTEADGLHSRYWVRFEAPKSDNRSSLQRSAVVARAMLKAQGIEVNDEEATTFKGGSLLCGPLPIYSKAREAELLKQFKTTPLTPSSPSR
ncbi:MAG TPA: hypothetical protein VFI02_20900 [Armatimonadota bacterium]|nr:hypothetical protein [Armatimonadota bacterium]